MSDTTFQNGVTNIIADWLQDINDFVYRKRVISMPLPSGGDDTAAVQAAMTAAAGNIARFPLGFTYNLDAASIVIQVGTVVDFNFCTFNAPTINSVPMFAVIPASLVASGRLTGADYPSSWKNGATPLPMDLDFNTMMYEHNVASRVSGIVFMNARVSSECKRTFINMYSVDNPVFQNCSIAPASNSAVRAYHCTGMTADKSNFFGGSGTYLVFYYKGLSPNIGARFSTTSAIRAFSCKGVMHPLGTSIFSSFGSSYVAFNGKFDGTILDGIDGVFWDTTPNYTEDAVGARGGTPIGFTSGTWYGKGSGFSVVGARIALPSCNPGGGGAQGRGVWMSAPHTNVLIEANSFTDAIAFTTGVSYGKFTGNKLSYTKPIGYAYENQGDSTSNLDSLSWDVSNNQVYNWQTIGGFAGPFRMCFTGGKFSHNEVFNPAVGTTLFVAWGANQTGVADYVIAEGNKMYHSLAAGPTFGSFGANNAHGWASDNLIIDTTGTIPVVSSGIRTMDDGAAKGFAVTASDDATGYAGLSFLNQAGTAVKAQYYWKAADSTVEEYVGAVRRIIGSFGTKFLTGLFPPKDDGTAQASSKLYAGSGAPNNANGANGDYYLRSDTPGTVNQRLYVKGGGSWSGIL